ATFPQQGLLFVKVPLAVLQTALQGGMIHPQLFMVTVQRLQAGLQRLVFLRQLLTLALLFTGQRAQALAAPLPFLAAPLAVLKPLLQSLPVPGQRLQGLLQMLDAHIARGLPGSEFSHLLFSGTLLARQRCQLLILGLLPPAPQPGTHSPARPQNGAEDRKSTRLNSSHVIISYAVFCLI